VKTKVEIKAKGFLNIEFQVIVSGKLFTDNATRAY